MSDEKPASSHDISHDATAVVSASTSKDFLGGSSSAPTKHLSIPPNRLTRTHSSDSLYSGSDISELSFGSTELGSVHHEGLVRTLSNVSATIAEIPGPGRWRQVLQTFWVANYGAFLVLISQMFNSTMLVATRLLETPGSHGAGMHPFQILFVRQSITVLITTVYAMWSKSVPYFPLGPPGKIRLLLVSRGVFGFLGVFGMYFSLLYLPISEATILTFLTPIGAGYTFSLLIPGETFSKQQQIASFVGLVGVIFIARPVSLFSAGSSSDSNVNPVAGNSTMPANDIVPPEDMGGTLNPTAAQHLLAVGVAMIGVIGSIGAITSIRSIGQRAHALLSVNYFSAWCTLVSLVALIVVPSVKFRLPGNALEWGLLASLGFCGFTMQLLLTKGMAYGGAAATTEKTLSNQQRHEDLELQARSSSEHPDSQTRTQARPGISTNSTQRPNSNPQIKGSGAKATSMLYTQMLFALASDKIIFGVTPGVWSWIGSGFILFGAVWVATDGGQKKRSEAETNDVAARSDGTQLPDSTDSAQEGVGLLADMDEPDPTPTHDRSQVR